MPTLSKEQIIQKLEQVTDPEFHIDIISMGLLRDIVIDETQNSVHIIITLTTPFCPFGPQIQEEIIEEVSKLGTSKVTTEITFNPPWKMPEGLRAMIGV